VLLIPKQGNIVMTDLPLLGLVLDEQTCINFKDYGISKIIVDLLDNKYPVLSIKIPDEGGLAGFSIIDQGSGLTFKLPDQGISEPLYKFLKSTKFNEKIPVMLAYFKGDKLLFQEDLKRNVLLILDGYVLE